MSVAYSEMAANGAALGAPEAVAAKLLDFAQPLDVGLLDSTVNAFYGAGSNQEVRQAPAGQTGPRPALALSASSLWPG